VIELQSDKSQFHHPGLTLQLTLGNFTESYLQRAFHHHRLRNRAVTWPLFCQTASVIGCRGHAWTRWGHINYKN